MPSVITNTFEYPYTNTPPIFYQIQPPSHAEDEPEFNAESNEYTEVHESVSMALEQMANYDLSPQYVNEPEIHTKPPVSAYPAVEKHSLDYIPPKLSRNLPHTPKSASELDRKLVVVYTGALSVIGLYILFRFTQTSAY